jgi:hypothetical protein
MMKKLNLLLTFVILVLVANIQHSRAQITAGVIDNGNASRFDMTTIQHTNQSLYNMGKI